MEVNNLLLPNELVELISQGKWELPDNPNELERLTGVNNFIFLAPFNMSLETKNSHDLINRGLGYAFNLRSSKKEGNPILDLEALDVDLSVMIAIDLNENILCLDYRSNPENPRVVGLITEKLRWIEVAPDFKSFAVAIGLMENDS